MSSTMEDDDSASPSKEEDATADRTERKRTLDERSKEDDDDRPLHNVTSIVTGQGRRRTVEYTIGDNVTIRFSSETYELLMDEGFDPRELETLDIECIKNVDTGDASISEIPPLAKRQ